VTRTQSNINISAPGQENRILNGEFIAKKRRIYISFRLHELGEESWERIQDVFEQTPAFSLTKTGRKLEAYSRRIRTDNWVQSNEDWKKAGSVFKTYLNRAAFGLTKTGRKLEAYSRRI
jgi:hypothetical protein